LLFMPGDWDTPQSVTVAAVDDAMIEGPHSGTISHSASSSDGYYDGLAIPSVSVNVSDNDVAGVTIAESDGSTDVVEGGATDSYEVVLDAQPSVTVTVTVSPDAQTDVGNGGGVPASLLFTPGDWDTPQSVTVAAVDDTMIEGPHSGTISHSASSSDGYYDGLAIPSVSVNVGDNEQATLYLPLVLRKHLLASDLVVADVIATRDDVQVVIANQGNGPISDEFWVDVYIAPRSTPVVNQPWPYVAAEGLVWGITADALDELAPGGMLTLTWNDAYYHPEWSRVTWPLAENTPVYVQVDALGDYDYAAVLESHEIAREGYNNVSSTLVTLSTRFAVEAHSTRRR
jgi:hypothetical protein